MKVSHSGQSEESGIGNQEAGRRGFEVRSSWVCIPRPIMSIVAVYVVVHAATLAPSLEDIDSINFALGLRHFDVANHQPHPPGYPVYIAFGRASLAVVHTLAPSLDPVRGEAIALAIWSALGGGLALLAIWSICADLGRYRTTPSPYFRVGGISFWTTLLL